MEDSAETFDVAIIGGGPGGATLGSFLRKYDSNIRVGIFEREIFPREHVGESLLPPVCAVLHQMGCWDEVEKANFPIKLGATHRWGSDSALWSFEFYPAEKFVDEQRPAKFEGQRRWTAFQVDRAIYDEILLNHAQQVGCDVRQGVKVSKIVREGNAVEALELKSGERIKAKYYIDASGHSGILRRAMGVSCSSPTALQNIAIWDYWQNAEWAIEIGVGGTRIQVLSLDYGWIWFIPLGPTRTSIGLVIPSAYYKESGLKPADLYERALQDEEIVRGLIANATSEGKLQTTKDWSFVAEKIWGDNWFLVGESSGFADPILSAGLSLTQAGARELAFTILELERGELDPIWLKTRYGERQLARLNNHIRFADYWYTANTQFKDLQKFTAEIAQENGLDLSPEKAWAWLSSGGFIDEQLSVGTGGFPVSFLRSNHSLFPGVAPKSPFESNNVFTLNLQGAEIEERAQYVDGRVEKMDCYVRKGKILPIAETFDVVLQILNRHSSSLDIKALLETETRALRGREGRLFTLSQVPLTLEAMILDGWVDASHDPLMPILALG